MGIASDIKVMNHNNDQNDTYNNPKSAVVAHIHWQWPTPLYLDPLNKMEIMPGTRNVANTQG